MIGGATASSASDIDWTLKSGVVDVWSAWLNQPSRLYDELRSHLSPDEKERAARFVHAETRSHFIVGRGLLRLLLAHYLQIPAREIQFSYGATGKPALVFPRNSRVTFNLSHSYGLALYAFALDRQVGIDVEKVTPIAEAPEIARRCYTPEQSASVSGRPAELEIFYHYWTRKEALCKCKGEGIAEYQGGEPAFHGFITELDPAEGYVAALAVEGPEFKVRVRDWSDFKFVPTDLE